MIPKLMEVFVIREDVGSVAAQAHEAFQKLKALLDRGAKDPDTFLSKLKKNGDDEYLPGEEISPELKGVKVIFASDVLNIDAPHEFIYMDGNKELKVDISKEERDNWIVMLWNNNEEESEELWNATEDALDEHDWWRKALPFLSKLKSLAQSFYHEYGHLHQFEKAPSDAMYKMWKKQLAGEGVGPGGVEALAQLLTAVSAFDMTKQSFRQKFPSAQSFLSAIRKVPAWDSAEHDFGSKRAMKYVAKSWEALSGR